MTSKVLVTGGAGFIGSHCVLELLKNGHQVVVLDSMANCAEGDIKPISLTRIEKLTGKNLSFYQVDITDEKALKNIFVEHNFDCVIHFAALKAVGQSAGKPLEYYHVNVTGTLNLLQAMRSAGVFKLIFASSFLVYGNPKSLPLTEDHSIGMDVTNPLGYSKYICEVALKDVCRTDKRWSIIALRIFNPVGADPSGEIGENPRGVPDNLMPFVSQVAAGWRPHVGIFGNDYDTKDGTGMRDYVHICDVSRAFLATLGKMEKTEAGFLVYNIGSGHCYSVLEIVAAFEKASGRKIPLVYTERRKGDLAKIYGDTQLAEKELGWKPKLGLEQMCLDLWNWIEKNPRGYEKSTEE